MYDNLKKFVDENKIIIKEKVIPTKEFKNLSTVEKDKLLEQILRDFKYID